MKRKGLVILVLVLLVAGGGLFYAYQNVTTIVRSMVEKEIPRLKFAQLDVGLNTVSISGVEYTSKSHKARLQTKSISISPSLWSLLTDTFEINDITIDAPQVVAYKRTGQVGLELPIPEVEKTTSARKQDTMEAEREDRKIATAARNVHIAKMRLNGGHGEFIDETVAGNPARFEFSDVNITVENVYVPSRAGDMPFSLQLKVPAKRTGVLSMKGVIDRQVRSGVLNVNAASLYLPMLAPYYTGPEVSLRLVDGQVSTNTTVTMKDGKYQINGYVQLADLKVDSGEFYGISAAKFQRYLEKHPEPIKINLEIEGDLDQPGSMRRSVIQAIVSALIKHVGGARLEGAKQKLGEGDIEGAKKELKDLKRELKNLFKR